MKNEEPNSFHEVLIEERNQIALRRNKNWSSPETPSHATPNGSTLLNQEDNGGKRSDPNKNLWNTVGLAFSGGGIRSATFNLGVLQGLASLNLLKCVDYLSTVSGGGYIGSWFTAWVKREGSLHNVAKQLHPDRHRQAEATREAEVFESPCTCNRKKGAAGDELKEYKSNPESEPEPIFHLRRYSNYLSPRLGLFSADSWTLISIYIRNLLANQLCLFPFILALLLVVRLITSAFSVSKSSVAVGQLMAGGTFVLLAAVFVLVYRSIYALERGQHQGPDNTTRFNFSANCRWMIILLTISAPLLCWFLLPNIPLQEKNLQPDPVRLGTWSDRLNWWSVLEQSPPGIRLFNSNNLARFLFVFTILHAAASLVFLAPKAFAMLRASSEGQKPSDTFWSIVRFFFASMGSGAAGGAVFYFVVTNVLLPNADNPATLITLGPPLGMLAFAFAANVEVILLGRKAAESLREWFARVCAWCLIVACGWFTLFGLSLFGGLWLLTAGIWARTLFSIAWIGSAIGGLLAASSASSGRADVPTWQDKVSFVTPYLFLTGLMCCMSLVAHCLVEGLHGSGLSQRYKEVESSFVRIAVTKSEFDTNAEAAAAQQRADFKYESDLVAARYLFIIRRPPLKRLLLAIAATILIAVAVSGCVDVNEFSLNALYANRLTRCYLGASRRKTPEDRGGAPPNVLGAARCANDLTGFDPADDLSIRELEIGRSEQTESGPSNIYWGPFPIINTALNLVSGGELAWQDRKAESFVLTPLRYGAKSLSYAKNDFDFKEAKNGSLGRIVAISGAAANPNMGYHSSPPVTALLALFNVRFGWWLPNPRFASPEFSQRRPKSLLKWLLLELFGFTNAEQSFVNLSDGGHFENLGVYELVRRRCRLIIVSDASADPETCFEDLGNMIRKCRSDFGIDIEIDLSNLRKLSGSRFSKSHCAVGTIRYDHVDRSAPVGTLLYLKPTLTGDEPGDVAHYSFQSGTFPQEPTLDQFFNESQFESYRQLGVHTAHAALEGIAERLDSTLNASTTKENSAEDCHEQAVSNLVYRLRKQWILPATHSTSDVFATNETFVRLHRDLRHEAELAALSGELYPEIKRDVSEAIEKEIQEYAVVTPSSSGVADLRAELHFATQMIQVMENAFVGMNLEQEHAHPLNAGWMNLFRRWGAVHTLQKYWPMLRHEFSREFVLFCEKQTALRTEVSELLNIDKLASIDAAQLKKEFLAEWSTSDEADRVATSVVKTIDLSWHLNQQQTLQSDPDQPLNAFWFVYVKVKDLASDEDDPLRHGFVAGIVGLRTLEDSSSVFTKPVHELYVWVRPSYREHRVGQTMLQALFKKPEFENRREKQHVFVLRYPKSAWVGAGNNIKKGRWLSYFDFYQFRRPDNETLQRIEALLLPRLQATDEKPTNGEVWKGFEVLAYNL